MRGDVVIGPYDFCVIYGIGVGADDHISPLTHKNDPNSDDVSDIRRPFRSSAPTIGWRLGYGRMLFHV